MTSLAGGIVATITVKGYLSIRDAMGSSGEIQLEMDDPTIRKALVKVAEMLGEGFTDHIFDPETHDVKPSNQVLLNGRHYRHFEDRLDTRLIDGDSIAIFPPVLGG